MYYDGMRLQTRDNICEVIQELEVCEFQDEIALIKVGSFEFQRVNLEFYKVQFDDEDCRVKYMPQRYTSVAYSKLTTRDVDSEDLSSLCSKEDGCSSDEDQVVFDATRMKYTDEARDGKKEKTFTVEDAVESMGFGRFQLIIYFVGGIITAADALEMMLLSVLSPVLRCEWFLTESQVASITTVVFLGMGISAPLVGLIGDKYGRKGALVLVTVSIGYFGFLTTFSPSYWWMLFLRGLVGFGMGGSPQGSSLLAEYLPSQYRAKLMLLSQIFWASGVTAEIFIASLVIPTLGWRWLMAFSAIPIIIATLLLTCVPESARYLVAAGRIDDANKVLKRGATMNKTTLPEGHLVSTLHTIELGRPCDLISRQYLRSTLHLWTLWFGTAFAYYGMVLVSSQVLTVSNSEKNLCKCSYLTKDDYTTMIVSTLGEFMCIPLNLLMIDRLGRRLTGTINLGFCGVFFALLQLNVNRSLLTFFMFSARGFSASTFSWVYLYSIEVYPTSIRTFGLGIASTWARFGAMVTPFIAQVLLAQSVSAALWVYAVVCFTCSASAFFLPIETQGREMPQFVEMEVLHLNGKQE